MVSLVPLPPSSYPPFATRSSSRASVRRHRTWKSEGSCATIVDGPTTSTSQPDYFADEWQTDDVSPELLYPDTGIGGFLYRDAAALDPFEYTPASPTAADATSETASSSSSTLFDSPEFLPLSLEAEFSPLQLSPDDDDSDSETGDNDTSSHSLPYGPLGSSASPAQFLDYYGRAALDVNAADGEGGGPSGINPFRFRSSRSNEMEQQWFADCLAALALENADGIPEAPELEYIDYHFHAAESEATVVPGVEHAHLDGDTLDDEADSPAAPSDLEHSDLSNFVRPCGTQLPHLPRSVLQRWSILPLV